MYLLTILMFLMLINLNFSWVQSLSLEQQKIALISDYIQLENRPVSIIAHLCWQRKYLAQLVKDLSKNIFCTGITIRNLDAAKLTHYSPQHQILYITDLACNKSDELLLKANVIFLFKAPYRWLIFNNKNSPTDYVRLLQALDIFPSSELLLATKLHNSSFNLQQPYKISPNKDGIIMEQYGMWMPKTHIIDYRSTNVLSERRSNFQKAIVRVTHVYANDDTINHLSDYKDLHIDTPTKINYMLTNYVMDMLNATIREQYSRVWGYPQPDGITFNGMIGDLMENRTDMGGTAASFYSIRSKVVKFISPLVTMSYAFIFRQPPMSSVHNLFALPFSIKIWIATMLLIALIDLFLYVALRWEWHWEKLLKGHIVETQGRLQPKGSELMLLNASALSQQGAPVEPKAASSRIVFILFFTSLMFLYTAYSANIVALLQSSSTIIKTPKDLIKSPLKVGSADTLYFRWDLQNSSNPIKRELNQKKNPEFISIPDGIAKVRQGYYAFMVEPGIGYRLIQQTFYEHEKCGLYQIDISAYPAVWAITQMNTTYLEILKSAYRKLAERGIQSRENQIFYTTKPQCDGKANHFTSVGIIDIYFAFYILLMGIFLAYIIFFVEILIIRHRRVQKHRRVGVVKVEQWAVKMPIKT